jgi:hypothetical protein
MFSGESRLAADLGAGIVELRFDDKTETCNILPAEGKPPAGDADG